MSFNNPINTTSRPIHQFAHPTTGQIFMITPNQHHHGFSYFVPRPYLDMQQAMAHPIPNSNRFIQAHIQPNESPLQIATTSAFPKPTLVPQPSQTKEQTNAKMKTIKENCISHYIDGQLIIETSKPLKDKKFRPSKKRKLSLQQHSVPLSTSPITTAPQSSETLEHTEAKLDEVRKVRSEMPKWSVAEVVDFIERHEDIRQYSSKFAEDEVDGKALLLMIDRNLNIQVLTSMFKHGPAMKIEAALSKYKYND